ncbi:MAG TPA: hypothetical protein VG842_12555 [Sediminibacterium sp.]|nr:hypothetical protein [Sediminibacterium sp.]
MKTYLALFAVLRFLPLQSQEQWLRPEHFYYSVRDLAKVQIVSRDSVLADPISAWVLRPGMEHQEEVKKEIKDHLIILPLSEPGTYILLVQSYHAKVLGQGTEQVHYDKTLLQVSHDFSESVTNYCGFNLEIVPEKNPAVSPENIRHAGLPKVRFRVYRYQQAAGQLALFYRYTLPDGTEETERLETDKKGWILVIRHPGACVLYTAIPPTGTLPGLSASLSFEFSQFFNEKPPTQ